MRIRVTTRADLFEKRKQQHIERGYGIEDERPIPVNGFCSFVAVRETFAADSLGELVAQAINGKSCSYGDCEVRDVTQNPLSFRRQMYLAPSL